jgi:hypothetical protein
MGLRQNLMGSADCEPTFGLVPGRPRHVYLQGGLSSPPELGPLLLGGRYRVLAELANRHFKAVGLLKLNLMVSSDCGPTSAFTRIRRSSEFIVELSPCRTPW